MADGKMTDIRQKAEQGLMDMANLISRREYNLGLVKGRQVMEQLVRGYARTGRIVYTDLADTIENLYKNDRIEKSTRDSFHTIRLLGNKAVHEGDNRPQDAEKSYYLLKEEIANYVKEEARREDRTPVSISGERRGAARETLGRSGAGRGRAVEAESAQRRRTADTRRAEKREQRVPTREDRLREQRRDRRNVQRKGERNQTKINIYDLLRILIPIICIILLIIFIRSIIPSKSKTDPTTTVAPTETVTETVPETTVPETEPETTAAVIRYMVKGDKVNARYADNQNRVYEQLAAGTEIGEVEEIEGSDFVKFTRDGISLVVNKNYITPIEE